jgi:hypothetical protein
MMLGDSFYRKSLTLGIAQASLAPLSLTRDFQRRIIMLFELSVGTSDAGTHGYYTVTTSASLFWGRND